MTDVVPVVLSVLVFVFMISVWNWITGNLPGSVGGGLHWLMLIAAAIVALVVYLATSRNY